MRVNKYLAQATGLSRREADTAVEQGRVTVNGIAAGLGAHIAETDSVALDDKPIAKQTSFTYMLFNKPIGYVCSRKIQGGTATIYQLLPEEYRALKPVGRLDKDSSGLLLLTDDGDFAHTMTHPSFHKTKSYEVSIDKPLAPLHRQMISDHGISLEDGPSKLELERMNEANDLNWRVNMHEGRNRQIRRTFLALGYVVTKLHRTHFGNYQLDSLGSGKYRTV